MPSLIAASSLLLFVAMPARSFIVEASSLDEVLGAQRWLLQG